MSDLNWVDFVLLGTIILYALFATSRGFIQVLAGLIGFVISLVAALSFHTALAAWLEATFSLSPIWAAPLAFILLWTLAQLVVGMLTRLMFASVIYKVSRSDLDRYLAVLPGAVHGILVSALFVTFLSLLPLPGVPREAILDSALGSRLVSATMAFEQPLEQVFGPALKETLGFVTSRPDPRSEELVELHFSVPSPTVDSSAEERMLALLNAERTQRELTPLVMDESLRRLARSYATEMFQQGYFSHVGRDGRDPFSRMRDSGILYSAAGENLALSPTTEIAHDGLMASPGHRENILNPNFRKIGLGIVDGGIHGKMFVQEFTD